MVGTRLVPITLAHPNPRAGFMDLPFLSSLPLILFLPFQNYLYSGGGDAGSTTFRRGRFGAADSAQPFWRREDSAQGRFGAGTIRRLDDSAPAISAQTKQISFFILRGIRPPKPSRLMGGLASLDHPPHILKITQTVQKIFKFINQFRSERKPNLAV